MSTSSTTSQNVAAAPPAQRPAPAGGLEKAAAPPSPLLSEKGKTSVASSVVQKIAGKASRETPGVHELGTGRARTMGAMRQRIPGSSGPSVGQGVAVEVGEREAAVDLDVVVEYGESIPGVADQVRRNVVRAIERFTGLQVIEVNIAVDDVYIPSDEPEAEPRVQ